MSDCVLRTRIDIQPESRLLALRTLLNSTLDTEEAVLVGTDVEDVPDKPPLVYFEFEVRNGGVTRLYAE